MTLLDSTEGGDNHNHGRWCRSRRRRLATQSRGKAGLFFAVIVGLQNGFYRKQRSPVGCFSERWPSEPPPEVCNILYPTLRRRHVRRLSVRELYYKLTRVSGPTSFSLLKSMRFGRVAIGGRRRRTIIYCLSYVHNGREIFTPNHGWTFFPSFQKQNKCNILSPASRKPDPPSPHWRRWSEILLISRYFDIYGLCCIHRRSTPVSFNNNCCTVHDTI